MIIIVIVVNKAKLFATGFISEEQEPCGDHANELWDHGSGPEGLS